VLYSIEKNIIIIITIVSINIITIIITNIIIFITIIITIIITNIIIIISVGVPRNLEDSVNYYLLAANQGFAPAQGLIE